MESKAKVAGHAVHPMLVAFPIGLLLTALIFDIIYLVSNEPRWAEASWYMIAAGVIGGLAAAIPGLIDWFAIPASTRAKRIGLIHAIGNVVVLGLFFLSWLLRADAPGALPAEAIAAEFLGAGIMAVTGWLGGELVNRLGVGVDDGAHLDAPSSLSGGAERRHSPQPAYAGVERRVYRSGR
jgi:uncharacterized membrane protein